MAMLKVLLIGLFVFAGFSPATHAAETKPEANMADMWVIAVKRGQEAAFEKAFVKHVEERQRLKDPRDWQTYVADTGKEMNYYYVRYCCFAWSDLDSYEKWSMDSKVMEHWMKHVDSLVEYYEHHYSKFDMANSHWPQTEDDYKFVGATHYVPKMGSYNDIERLKKAFSDAAKEMKWPYYWAWDASINGEPGMSLVVPYKNYAAMEPPEKTFMVLLGEHLKSEEKAKKMLADWQNNFHTVHYEIYRWRPDLSMKMKK